MASSSASLILRRTMSRVVVDVAPFRLCPIRFTYSLPDVQDKESTRATWIKQLNQPWKKSIQRWPISSSSRRPGNGRKPMSLSFPRRVFIPWLAGTFICDYLQPSESLEVVKDHCAEIMSMEVFPDSSDILQSEAESVALVAESFWDIAAPFQPPSTSIPGKVSVGDTENKDGRKAVAP